MVESKELIKRVEKHIIAIQTLHKKDLYSRITFLEKENKTGSSKSVFLAGRKTLERLNRLEVSCITHITMSDTQQLIFGMHGYDAQMEAKTVQLYIIDELHAEPRVYDTVSDLWVIHPRGDTKELIRELYGFGPTP